MTTVNLAPIAALAISATVAALKLRDSGQVEHLRTDIDAFIAKVKDTALPEKADGTPWTDEDVLAAGVAAGTGFDQTLADSAADKTQAPQG